MEMHHLELKKKGKKAFINNNLEIESQKEELKIMIENWKTRKKIDIFIQSVQKKNKFLQEEPLKMD